MKSGQFAGRGRAVRCDVVLNDCAEVPKNFTRLEQRAKSHELGLSGHSQAGALGHGCTTEYYIDFAIKPDSLTIILLL